MVNFVKNIMPGQTPKDFGGSANFAFKTTLHGMARAEPIPLVFDKNLLPDKRGKDFSQVSPFFNQIPYNSMQDTDLPCRGVREVLVGMNTPMKNPNTTPSLSGAFPQPQPNSRRLFIGLGHMQEDIQGQSMRLLPSVNAFDVTKTNPLNSMF